MKPKPKALALAMIMVGVVGMGVFLLVRHLGQPRVNWYHRLGETNPEGRRRVELLFDQDGNERSSPTYDLRQRLTNASETERAELLEYLGSLLREGEAYLSQLAGYALALFFESESNWEYLTESTAQAMAENMVKLTYGGGARDNSAILRSTSLTIPMLRDDEQTGRSNPSSASPIRAETRANGTTQCAGGGSRR